MLWRMDNCAAVLHVHLPLACIVLPAKAGLLTLLQFLVSRHWLYASRLLLRCHFPEGIFALVHLPMALTTF